MLSNERQVVSQAFACEKRFYDDANFPRGFKRSGNFTLTEAELLEAHGALLKQLYNHDVQPANELQKHFLSVMNGETPAINMLEKAWLKYIKLTTCKAKFHTVFGKSRSSSADTTETDYSLDSDEL